MGAFNPTDIIKDHKDVLLPLLGAVVIILGLGYFLGEGGDYFDDLGGLGDIPALEGGGGDDSNGGGDHDHNYESAPEMQLKTGVDYEATIKTNFGDIKLDLYEDAAPKTVNNFVFLAKDNFYDGLTFHRVVEDFVIQGGDPNGDGSGGPGYRFEDEINPNSVGLDEIKVSEADFLGGLYNPTNSSTLGYSPSSLETHANKSLSSFYDDVIGYEYDYSLDSIEFSSGVIAMANSGPSTNGSQFFITVSGSDTSSLNGRHTVFGKVVDGMDVVDEISGVSINAASKPLNEVVIEDIVIEEE